MRRGQLTYANSLMERALRTYKAVAFRMGQAETAAGLGEIQRRRGFLSTALQTLEDAHKQARMLHNEYVEGRTQVSIGDIYRQQGKFPLAAIHYRDAQEQMTKLGETSWIVQSETKQASLAVLNGRLDEAQAQLTKAQNTARSSSFVAQLTPALLITEAQLLLTIGDYEHAGERFNEAHTQATEQQEPLLAADASGLARVQLARGELETAMTTFLEAGRQYQQLESTSGDGDAVLGVAQVLIGLTQWDEASQRS